LFTHSLCPQSEYPASDSIPLHLVLTSENYEAIDLFSVSHVIDVRLEKVIAFGDRAGIVRPLTLRDRDSFHRSELAARANWVRDGEIRALPPDEHHRRPRWRVRLNGVFQRIRGVELTPSYEEPNVSMAIMVRKPNLGKDMDGLTSLVVYCELLSIPRGGFPLCKQPEQSACDWQD
jgi:hypothetical protein